MDEERETILFTASGDVIAEARKKITGCSACNSDAGVPFSVLLDQVMLFSGAHTDYILTESVRCPFCGMEITEGTLVDWD